MARSSNVTDSVTDNPEVEAVEPDAEVDVVEASAEAATKEPKAPARPPVPEGFVTPIGFAKALSEKLGKEIRPQVIYSYIRQNGAESKNPFPVTEAEGRQNLIRLEEGMEWWEAKDARVEARKANAAEKAAKKAAKAEAAPAEAEGETQAEIVEAE